MGGDAIPLCSNSLAHLGQGERDQSVLFKKVNKNKNLLLTATLYYYILDNMDERLFDNWTTQLRKGLLQLCVLNAISGRRLYGYDIVRQLRESKGLVIAEGTIYPILSRFKRDGLVRTKLEESSEGPARKYYQLTNNGKKLLARMNKTWKIIVRGVDNIQSAQPNRE